MSGIHTQANKYLVASRVKLFDDQMPQLRSGRAEGQSNPETTLRYAQALDTNEAIAASDEIAVIGA